MIKLAYVVSTLSRSGPTRQLYYLAKFLSRDAFELEVITLSPDPLENLEGEFSKLNIRLHSLRLSRVASLISGKRRLNKLLNKLKPDIVHSQGLRADWFCAMLNDYPIRIATQRNNPLDDYPPLYGFLIGSLAAKLHFYAFVRMPTVVACSQAISTNNSSRGFKSIVIRNGVDLASLGEIQKDSSKKGMRRELNLPIAGRLFVHAGPLIYRKNPEFLIRTFLKFSDSTDTLCLLGDGPLLGTCRKLVINTENVIVRGLVGNVSQYLHAADVFVSASLSEGMPNAVLEGLAVGLPVILSDIPAHREIMDLCPNAGWLFAADNEIALSRCLKQAANSISTHGDTRPALEEYFSAKSMVEAYKQLYYHTLASS